MHCYQDYCKQNATIFGLMPINCHFKDNCFQNMNSWNTFQYFIRDYAAGNGTAAIVLHCYKFTF